MTHAHTKFFVFINNSCDIICGIQKHSMLTYMSIYMWKTEHDTTECRTVVKQW